MRSRLLVERRNEAELLLINGVCEALLFDVSLQCESRRSLCGQLQYLRAAHPVQRELSHILVVAQRRDEVQHVRLRHETKRVDSPALGLGGVSAAVVGLELPALEQCAI